MSYRATSSFRALLHGGSSCFDEPTALSRYKLTLIITLYYAPCTYSSSSTQRRLTLSSPPILTQLKVSVEKRLFLFFILLSFLSSPVRVTATVNGQLHASVSTVEWTKKWIDLLPVLTCHAEVLLQQAVCK